jgi:hypothetical protein
MEFLYLGTRQQYPEPRLSARPLSGAALDDLAAADTVDAVDGRPIAALAAVDNVLLVVGGVDRVRTRAAAAIAEKLLSGQRQLER